MREYRHKSCKSVMYTHIGDGPNRADYPPRSRDWRFADGSQPGFLSTDCAACPDCGASFLPNPRRLEALDGESFFAHMPRVIPTKPTFWQRIKKIFNKD